MGIPEYEHFDVAAEAAVAWIVSNEVRLLSIETVGLPGTPDVGKNNESYLFNLGSGSSCYQFVRAWYHER